MKPGDAAQEAINRISKVYPNFVGAIVAIDKFGNHGKETFVLTTIYFI